MFKIFKPRFMLKINHLHTIKSSGVFPVNLEFSCLTYSRVYPVLRNFSLLTDGTSKCKVKNLQFVTCYKTLCSSVESSRVQKSEAALQTKKRAPRKKSTVEDVIDKKMWSVIAYSSAEEYDIDGISAAIQKQGLYKKLHLPDDAGDVLHVTANYQVDEEPRHIYFFSEGSVVFWNVSNLEQQAVLSFLKPHQINAYDEALVLEEKDDLQYLYAEHETKFSKGRIFLSSEEDTQLDTYAFSNGLAHSVKLAMCEAKLENFINSVKWVAENMKCGKKVKMSRSELSIKRGELFSLRHVINLSSDLLDIPDFYWDRQQLEKLYTQICNYLNITNRTKVMNERLSYCSELIDLLTSQMTDQHHVRLELMIIALILIEVVFESVHFVDRLF